MRGSVKLLNAAEII